MYSADAALRVTHHQYCVLYESTSGKIVSVFQSISLEGAGPAPRPADIESRAKELSAKLIETYSKRPFDQKKVKTLVVGPEAFEKPGAKKVDLERLTLVSADD
jgi:hypothetical protein